MPPLRATSDTDTILADAVRELQELFGERLLNVTLYGSAAGPDFVPGRSDLNLAVVVDRMDGLRLHALRDLLPRWRRRGLATPLVVDRGFLDTARDVFPMELHDIQERHRLLHGAPLFAELEVHDTHLRHQCEYEARGKLLRLRELYLEVGGRRRDLRALLLDSLKTFLIVMRNLNRLRDARDDGSYADALTTFERTFDRHLPVTRQLLAIRAGEAAWTDDDEGTFAGYVSELEAVVHVVDTFAPGAPS